MLLKSPNLFVSGEVSKERAQKPRGSLDQNRVCAETTKLSMVDMFKELSLVAALCSGALKRRRKNVMENTYFLLDM